jgi:hypothetical protein
MKRERRKEGMKERKKDRKKERKREMIWHTQGAISTDWWKLSLS